MVNIKENFLFRSLQTGLNANEKYDTMKPAEREVDFLKRSLLPPPPKKFWARLKCYRNFNFKVTQIKLKTWIRFEIKPVILSWHTVKINKKRVFFLQTKTVKQHSI